jgi:hypothetical protein
VSQLPLGRLSLSRSLQAADPPALSRAASTCAAAADHLRGQSAALDGLTARMRAGSWSSPAGNAYIQRATEYARRVRIAAGLAQDLGEALSALAGRLQGAKAEATAAVARGHQVNAAAEQFNDRMRSQQHAIADPHAALIYSGQAAALSRQMHAVADALTSAERAAREAWQRASAQFDLISYASPQMREQMQGSAWDPAAHVALSATLTESSLARACGPMDELTLPRGGVISGPDGRRYDLVVQTTRGSNGRLLVSTQDEETREPSDGWQQLAVRYGTTSYGRKTSTWEKVAVAVGGAAGMSYPEGSTFAPSLLGDLQFLSGGGAFLPDRPASRTSDPVKEATAEPPRGQEPNRYWIAPTTGLAAGRRASAPDGIGLIDGGISGLLLASRLDDRRAAAYRIVFEENSAGERRARLQLFRVASGPDEPPTTVAEGGYVDASGHLAGAPVTGQPLHRRPIITEPGR